MATLQALRTKAGVFIAIFIGLALLAFILTDLLGSNGSMFSNNDVIGEIDGQTIKYQDYQSRVDETETFYKMVQQPATPEQIRESVWQQIKSEIVMGKACEKAGIDVTGEELLDMVTGSHISPALMGMFTNPQTGVYDRVAAENFLRNRNNDYQAAFYWNFMEKMLKENRLSAKYMNLINSSIYCTDVQAKVEAEKRAKGVDMAFVSVRYNTIPDSTITVSSSDIKARYEKNKDLYKVQEGRDLEYISFPIKPTEADVELTRKSIEELKADFSAADVDAYRFAQNNAETPAVEVFLSQSQLPQILADFVKTAVVGEVYGPYREGDFFKISRLVSVTQRPDSVKASHILLREKAALADSLMGVANASNFAELARNYSEDPGSAINGGDLDWFTDGRMVPTFNEACFTGVKGSIVKVESEYGIHIIYLQDKGVSSTKYSIATVDKSIQYSTETHRDVFNLANDFATKVSSKADFDALADTMNYVKRFATSVRSNAQSINNVASAREVVRWAYKAKIGEVSDIFECGDEFIIASLVKKQDAGYAILQDVSPMLTRDLLNEKKTAIVNSAIQGKSLAQIAEAYNSKVDSASNVSFASNTVAGAGIEPNLVAAAVSAEKGKISEAVKGSNAAYVFEVTNEVVTEADVDAAKAAYNQQFSSMSYMVGDILLDVETEDNRINFY
jgi:peptidyl-prolyl cis-trans isomerase D